MKKKTVFLIRNAAPQDFGGAERLPVFIAKEITLYNYQPILLSRSKKMLEFAQENDVTTMRSWWWSFQNWSGVNSVLIPVYCVWQIILAIYYLTLFLRYKPTVIHIQSKDDFIAGTLAGWMCGIRVVWSDYADLKHIWRNITIWYKNPSGKLVYWCAHLAHGISIVSKSEEDLVTVHLPASSRLRAKLQIIHIGIADKSVTAVKRPKNNIIFCAASRIVTDKGIGELISAFKEVQKTIPSSQLWIIGDGPEKQLFDTGHHNVTFFGHLKEPLASIKAADVFLLPTYHEGFSVALVEASMLGKAIIATSVGGNVEIIKDNETGILVKVKDSNDLVTAMTKLATDSALREKLGKNARRQYEEKFQLTTMIKTGIIPLYEGK